MAWHGAIYWYSQPVRLPTRPTAQGAWTLVAGDYCTGEGMDTTDRPPTDRQADRQSVSQSSADVCASVHPIRCFDYLP